MKISSRALSLPLFFSGIFSSYAATVPVQRSVNNTDANDRYDARQRECNPGTRWLRRVFGRHRSLMAESTKNRKTKTPFFDCLSKITLCQDNNHGNKQQNSNTTPSV